MSPDQDDFRIRLRPSERHGAGEWAVERVALLALIPLGVWLAVAAFGLTGAGYEAVMDWFANRLNAVLLGLTLIVFCFYASLAWKVIIEDYIHRPGTKGLLIAVSNLVFLLVAAAGVFLITRLALGSAPLPAGLGG